MTKLTTDVTTGNTIDPFTLTKGLFSYPHVDHDPLHDTSNAEEDREEPVYPEAAFARDKIN